MIIYRVNMSNLSVKKEDVPQEWQHWGGRAFTSAVVAKEVDPACNPMGAKNKLVFAPGLLSGTNAPNSGRMSVGAKSPLTGTIKESNVGGSASQKLGKMNIKGIIIEGQPAEDKYYNPHVDKDGIKIQEETALTIWPPVLQPRTTSCRNSSARIFPHIIKHGTLPPKSYSKYGIFNHKAFTFGYRKTAVV